MIRIGQQLQQAYLRRAMAIAPVYGGESTCLLRQLCNIVKDHEHVMGVNVG